MNTGKRRNSQLHVSLVAIPDAVISTLSGIYDVLNSFRMLAEFDDVIPTTPPFKVEIVGSSQGTVALASGLPITTHRSIDELKASDIVIVPSVLLDESGWKKGRYPDIVDWVTALHAKGAQLCSACSGIFLLAESGLFDDKDTTVHWAYADQFRNCFPDIPLFPEKVLIASGPRGELISSGASNSWHDLVLYLIAAHVGSSAAQSIARFFALQWHHDGLAHCMPFAAVTDHGDAVVIKAQEWVEQNFATAHPVEEMVGRSMLPERSFKRRFGQATGLSPIAYVQRLRIEDAKRRLERTADSVEEISYRVGYEDASYFRRLFKRLTGISPAKYRRKFRVPDFSRKIM